MTNETHKVSPLLSIIKPRVRSEARDLPFLGHHLLRLLYFMIQFPLDSWTLFKVKSQSSPNYLRIYHTMPHLQFREQINKSCRFGQDLSHFADVNHSGVKLQTTFVSPSVWTMLSWQHNLQQPHYTFWKCRTCATHTAKPSLCWRMAVPPGTAYIFQMYIVLLHLYWMQI